MLVVRQRDSLLRPADLGRGVGSARTHARRLRYRRTDRHRFASSARRHQHRRSHSARLPHPRRRRRRPLQRNAQQRQDLQRIRPARHHGRQHPHSSGQRRLRHCPGGHLGFMGGQHDRRGLVRRRRRRQPVRRHLHDRLRSRRLVPARRLRHRLDDRQPVQLGHLRHRSCRLHRRLQRTVPDRMQRRCGELRHLHILPVRGCHPGAVHLRAGRRLQRRHRNGNRHHRRPRRPLRR